MQSRLIYRRIRDLAAEKNKTVLVFVEDVAASGGYMIAVAGDEIIADPSSIVGSIGVVSASFGLNEAIKKIGVERRVHTAGRNKAVLDPFLPEKPEDVERLKALQLEVHETFIDIVKERRAAKLKDDPDLFTGLFWTAKRGVELGLVDALGDMRSVLKDRFGPKTRLQLITQPRGLFGRRLGIFGSSAGHSPADIAGAAVDGLHRRGRAALAVEQVRPLKNGCNGATMVAWRIRKATRLRQLRRMQACHSSSSSRWSAPSLMSATSPSSAKPIVSPPRCGAPRSRPRTAPTERWSRIPKTGEYRLAKD